MTSNKLARARQNFKRLKNLSWPKKAYYVANAIAGETLRSRSVGTLGFRLVEISLTDRCQCDCFHCYAAKSRRAPEKNEFSTNEIKLLLDQIVEMHATEVCFSGGEPLIRKDLSDLVRYATQKGLVTKINTNGILLSEELVLELQEAGLCWCAVSIDSPDPHEHDELRKYTGCYEKAIKGIELLVKHEIPVCIATYAKKDRVYSKDLAEIVTLGHKLNVSMVRINFPVPMGCFEDQDNEVLSIEEREEVRKLLEDPIVSMEAPKEKTKCTASVTKINVMTNGDVTPCVFVPKVYGNVRKQSFREIWQAMADFDRMYKPNGQCPMCDPVFRKKLINLSESST